MDALTKKAYSLRKDILGIVFKSSSGHIGGDLSVIDILTTLYYDIMNVNQQNANAPSRDRFILSKGHCADALYAVLADKGFFDKQVLKDTFSAYGSNFIGHPDNRVNGVEMCSGSLGHGLSVGAGMALALKKDENDARVYVVMGDGEMAEGSIYEAMTFAAHYHLDNLCATVDLNGLQISGRTDDIMSTADLNNKFMAFGWNVINVSDGNDCNELSSAYKQAASFKGKPSVIIAHTVKGKGVSFMENNIKWHHGVMSDEQYKLAIKNIEAAML